MPALAQPRASASLVATILVAGILACSRSPVAPTPVAPTPSPSPSPTYPAARPNATAFENVAFLRDLERTPGVQSDLALIGGLVTLDGRGAWRYLFYEEERGRVVEWSITSTGQVHFHANEPFPTRLYKIREIGPSLTLDSPDVIALALRSGGRPFVNRFPDAKASVVYGHDAGHYGYVWNVVFAEITFEARGEAPCEHGPFLFDTRTGELLTRYMSCLDDLGTQ